MNRALILIDLQEDYLKRVGLQPHRDTVCANASLLRNHFCTKKHLIIHVWTTIRDPNERMRHWREQDIQLCKEGTPGHGSPLAPKSGETLVHKRGYSAFHGTELADILNDAGIDTVVLAGLLTRACVRSTAIDAFQYGFDVWVAEDAIGDDDPLHATLTRNYLQKRSIKFVDSKAIIDGFSAEAPPFPHLNWQGATLRSVVNASTDAINEALQNARNAQKTPKPESALPAIFEHFAVGLENDQAEIAQSITKETGKTIRESKAEVAFTVALTRSALSTCQKAVLDLQENEFRATRVPLGTIAAITPWNNPLAIPLGKIIPAILYGNAVVLKPSPYGNTIASELCERLTSAGLPEGLLHCISGDHANAENLIMHPETDAATFTGSTLAGISLQAMAMNRHIPFQGEMGGNNASIVWSDANLVAAARCLVTSAFSNAGQRCTAIRRVLIHRDCYDDFVHLIKERMAQLRMGDPMDPATDVGPQITSSATARLNGFIQRARNYATCFTCPEHEHFSASQTAAFFPPTCVFTNDVDTEIVQTETFGPIMVVQSVQDWETAVQNCNGVPQGLLSALFSQDAIRHQSFIDRVHAGILRINPSSPFVAATAPFAGWKASGFGPAEHGPADIEFYTRWQTVYK